ncbi:uncharacterized protein BCR38DRAFT_96879 [Pseudomassariella vexata]|uniref:Uncharacterized protein n=1 Tax=Pseudomassariella vexata TaxID=1141098 RepID=A0A1Y2EF22_9PEZI|nr:uncharacterized protein BCR38DRAFT_96879 [Pseudomassariella vexata]ORY69987.1 hypothetical protein BCR38DRAFT_96879 [Pseudomassariella vexata]
MQESLVRYAGTVNDDNVRNGVSLHRWIWFRLSAWNELSKVSQQFTKKLPTSIRLCALGLCLCTTVTVTGDGSAETSRAIPSPLNETNGPGLLGSLDWPASGAAMLRRRFAVMHLISDQLQLFFQAPNENTAQLCGGVDHMRGTPQPLLTFNSSLLRNCKRRGPTTMGEMTTNQDDETECGRDFLSR